MIHAHQRHVQIVDINEKLGGSYTFECDECKMSIDRDMNVAMNIYVIQIISR